MCLLPPECLNAHTRQILIAAYLGMIPIGTQNAARAAAKRRKSLEKKGVFRVNFDDLRVSPLPPLALSRSVLGVMVQGLCQPSVA